MGTFGERLKDLRKSKNLTQEKLAEHLSVNRDALAKWETDRAFPDLNTIKELADFFEVATDYLLGRNEDNLASRIAAVLKQNKGLLSQAEEEFLLKMNLNYIETIRNQKKQ